MPIKYYRVYLGDKFVCFFDSTYKQSAKELEQEGFTVIREIKPIKKSA